jgi:hypothetical protein
MAERLVAVQAKHEVLHTQVDQVLERHEDRAAPCCPVFEGTVGRSGEEVSGHAK